MQYKVRQVFRHSWVFVPLFLYISLFTLNPIIKGSSAVNTMKSVDSGCRPNFIVTVDQVLFERTVYQPLAAVENLLFDLISAIPYLAHFLLPFLYSYWLVFVKKEIRSLYRFILAFGIVSFSGVLTQYLLPTPPPWMLIKDMKPTANFDRIDRALGFGLFNSIYSKSPLVCGAFPSLHTAWPTVILFTKPWVNKYFAWSHVGLMLFAATYSLHHWVIDVAFGFAYAYVSCRIATYSIQYIITKEESLELMPVGSHIFSSSSTSASSSASSASDDDFRFETDTHKLIP